MRVTPLAAVVLILILVARPTGALAHRYTRLAIEASGVLDVPFNDMRYDTGIGLGARLALIRPRYRWEFGGFGFLDALGLWEEPCSADAPCFSGKHRLWGGGLLVRRKIAADGDSRVVLDAGAGYSDRWWQSDVGERNTHRSSGAFVSVGLTRLMRRSALGFNTLGIGLLVMPRDGEPGIYSLNLGSARRGLLRRGTRMCPGFLSSGRVADGRVRRLRPPPPPHPRAILWEKRRSI